MNRVIKISAWLVIGLFIASAPAIFPGVAAAASNLDIRIESDSGGSPRASLCSPILPGTGQVLMPRTIQLPDPVSGVYHLRVNGLKTGEYTLYLKAYSDSGSTSDVRFPHMSIKNGEVHHYRVNFSARRA